MRKLSEKIHYQFISGKINAAIYTFIQKIASTTANDSDITLFDTHIKNLISYGATTEQDCKQYFYARNHLLRNIEALISKKLPSEVSEQLYRYAFKNRHQYDTAKKTDCTRFALDCLKIYYAITKTAHPNNTGIETDISVRSPYNIDQWVKTMRYIYDVSNTNNLPLDSVAQQVTSKWEENERIHFQRWMRYYQEGNYDKYNVKTAQFFQTKTEKYPDLKPVKDLFDTSAFPKQDPQAEKQQKLDDVRKKLLGRFKSVIELLDKYRTVLPSRISDDLLVKMHDLQKTVWKLSLAASMVDSINRTSNQFKKFGFLEGAQELKKIAQEVAENKLPATTELEVEGPVAIPAPNAEIAPEPVKEKRKNTGGGEGVGGSSGSENSIRVPEVNIDEETIEIPDFSSATHRDALLKLEEINKVISERNVVRALAAVDIILGQLGIASYFPQLSEAQSKMMDAFNYAGTRVAETIGQMRGGTGGLINQTPAVPKPATEKDEVNVTEEAEKPVGEIVQGPPK